MKSKFRWPRERFPSCDDDIHDLILIFILFIRPRSDSLVKVRAQVMTRDESTEGWLPLQGGGLANVSIRKRARMPDVGGHEYIIYGQRISDQTVKSFGLNSNDFYSKLNRISGDSELCHQQRSSVQQSHADIPSLAVGQATERSHISDGSRRKGFRQRSYQGLRWSRWR